METENMDNNSQIQQPVKLKNPVELLNEQTQSLSEMVEIQKLQREQISKLREQNTRIIQLLENVSDEDPKLGLFYVKIEDVNMPFGSLVGFMLKVSLAAIPAAIILGVLYALVIAIFGGIFSAL
jgi:hypothetical protein